MSNHLKKIFICLDSYFLFRLFKCFILFRYLNRIVFLIFEWVIFVLICSTCVQTHLQVVLWPWSNFRIWRRTSISRRHLADLQIKMILFSFVHLLRGYLLCLLFCFSSRRSFNNSPRIFFKSSDSVIKIRLRINWEHSKES